MRDPPREEDAGGWSAGGLTRVHAHVIDRHQDHDETTQHVDRPEARGRRHIRWLLLANDGYFAGTRRFSSSNQCCTKIICAGGGFFARSLSSAIKNRRPSDATS
jgi:hypothetical protein